MLFKSQSSKSFENLADIYSTFSLCIVYEELAKRI
jgi:hypothetical protein